MTGTDRSSRAAEPAVATHQLAKYYGDAPALEPLDLEIADGDRVTLIGHNGSGKTTLLKMLPGMG